MLFVDVEESVLKSRGKSYAILYEKLMSGVVSRIKEASAFVLDPTATEMAANVFFGRPSSIVSALKFVKLPAPSVWIEYSNIAARNAFARLGNENNWTEGGILIEKSGVLLTQREGIIDIEAIAQFRKDDGDRLIELLSVKCSFDTTPGFLVRPKDLVKIDHAATGAAKRFYDMIGRDPIERAARDEIDQRFSHILHPDFDVLIEQVGAQAIIKVASGHVNDVRNMFKTQILPSLILMNCRNAVEQEAVEAPAKLNKARKSKGRPQIGPYRIIKLKLRPKVARRYEEKGGSGKHMSAGPVMGHFKTRKTGVYWWSDFYAYRSGAPSGPRPVHVVTR